MSGTTSGAALWGRYMSIIVANTAGEGRDLIFPNTPGGPSLHVTFTIKHIITSTPHTASVRVYNVSNDTANYIANVGPNTNSNWSESNGQLVIRAGYTGNYGTIFTGGIRQVRVGRENPTDTYVDVFAADSDTARNWGFINTSLSAGYSQQDVALKCAQYMKTFNTSMGTNVTYPANGEEFLPVKPPAASPRGRALYGPTKYILRDLADAHDNTWSLDNNTLNFLPRTAFAPGDAIVLTSRTGFIGMPELTNNGLHVRCLLNPAIGPGTRIKIDNASVQYPAINLQYNAVTQNTFPSTNSDGIYKVLWVDHSGDNRGNTWYSDMICLSIDPSAGLPLSGIKDVASGIPG